MSHPEPFVVFATTDPWQLRPIGGHEYQRIFGAFGFFGAFDREWSLGVFASRFGGFLTPFRARAGRLYRRGLKADLGMCR